jgi:hypothetical protein
MAARDADWYFKASNELLLDKDNDDARALLEETRAAIRNGEHPTVTVASLKVKGTRNNAQGVVNRALTLELPGVLSTAAADLAAGRPASPAIALAREIATNVLGEKPSGSDFAARMKGFGAPDALITHLAGDPALKAGARRQAWAYLTVGVLAALGAVWFYTSTPPGDMPYGSGALGAVAVILLGLGVTGLRRK